jgi:hypothetical protein
MAQATKIMIFDCGCVPSRPKTAGCKSYGTRWRIYKIQKDSVITGLHLRCRDCGREYTLALSVPGIQNIRYVKPEEDEI